MPYYLSFKLAFENLPKNKGILWFDGRYFWWKDDECSKLCLNKISAALSMMTMMCVSKIIVRGFLDFAILAGRYLAV